ncbi:DUF6090 family protein [Psychroserpens sp. SPM9]|uniref:DUF6090 family protein n=1 Tax=Psychroserpens sp. SPM9 TaxID=2975598 RepID=UPI0021A8FE7F|nr:DUF6090 family protein [Psychroserpens sp. SPM9]MDG5492015.1 DUF6090 family protein [Psychroserpens sp. SPM9]
MIKFFRKIRQNLLSEGKTEKPASRTGRYFKYAIGEIILVVIGILIALQINNWNENKKTEHQLNNIYKEVELNLKSDLSNLDIVINQYEQLELRLETMISEEYSNIPLDSINAKNYSECIPCQGDVIAFIPFEFKDKGVELLKTYNDYNAKENKGLTNEIIQFYKNFEHLNLVLDKLKEESFNTIRYFEEFSWYSDFMHGKYNPKTIDFFANNRIFKNKVVTYRLIAIQNYLPYLREYKKSATTLLEKLKTTN